MPRERKLWTEGEDQILRGATTSQCTPKFLLLSFLGQAKADLVRVESPNWRSKELAYYRRQVAREK